MRLESCKALPVPMHSARAAFQPRKPLALGSLSSCVSGSGSPRSAERACDHAFRRKLTLPSFRLGTCRLALASRRRSFCLRSSRRFGVIRPDLRPRLPFGVWLPVGLAAALPDRENSRVLDAERSPVVTRRLPADDPEASRLRLRRRGEAGDPTDGVFSNSTDLVRCLPERALPSVSDKLLRLLLADRLLAKGFFGSACVA
mmetsp:Transcript_72244/g.172504  ORF Transcript_72244/g.172504 Transcript_72244/m.172504 type:complete len:201 (-) Transcript_72244:59-661(-)